MYQMHRILCREKNIGDFDFQVQFNRNLEFIEMKRAG